MIDFSPLAGLVQAFSQGELVVQRVTRSTNTYGTVEETREPVTYPFAAIMPNEGNTSVPAGDGRKLTGQLVVFVESDAPHGPLRGAEAGRKHRADTFVWHGTHYRVTETARWDAGGFTAHGAELVEVDG